LEAIAQVNSSKWERKSSKEIRWEKVQEKVQTKRIMIILLYGALKTRGGGGNLTARPGRRKNKELETWGKKKLRYSRNKDLRKPSIRSG